MLRFPIRSNHYIHIRKAATARALHTVTADFINHGPDGALVTNKVSIEIGDPGEAYVMIPPEVGRAFQAGSLLTNGSAPTNGSAKCALNFFHDTQQSAHSTLTVRLPALWTVTNLCLLQESTPSYSRLVSDG